MSNLNNCPMCGSKPLPSAGKTHVYCTSSECDLHDNPIPNRIWNFFGSMRRQTKQLLKWHLIEDGIHTYPKVTDGLGDRNDFYKTMGLTDENGQWTDTAYKIAKVQK